MNLALRSLPKTGLLVGTKIKWVSLTCTYLNTQQVLSLVSSRRCTGQGERSHRGQEGRKVCKCRRQRVCFEGALAITLLNIKDGD